MVVAVISERWIEKRGAEKQIDGQYRDKTGGSKAVVDAIFAQLIIPSKVFKKF